jgi:F420-dependent oxidoreductase-like protein
VRVSAFHFISWGVVPAPWRCPQEGTSPIEDYVEQLRQFRDEGFTTVWTPQLWREPDLLTVLALALDRVDGITVGTGVIPIQTRHPAVLAQQALTVNLVSGGRLKLGIGMTHPMISEGMYGIPWDRSVRRLNEYLDGLEPLLRGEEATATGELTCTRTALDIPLEATPPPIYVAALGPQLLRITARRSAGTFTWMTGPRTIADHVIPTLEAACPPGRPRVEVLAGFPVCVTDQPDAARAAAESALAVYGMQPSYRAMLDREGWADAADAAIIGDEATVGARFDELAALGVDEVPAYIQAPTPEDERRTRAFLATLARAG